jgi:hypothetical protein
MAEQVEKVNPDLVKRDRDGKLQTVRYDAVNAMLLNEFLKKNRQVEEEQAAINDLKSVVPSSRRQPSRPSFVLIEQAFDTNASTGFCSTAERDFSGILGFALKEFGAHRPPLQEWTNPLRNE